MDILKRKYATATHFYATLIKRAVVDFAVGADWTPAAGDVKVSIDGGAAANIGTLPTAIAMGNTAIWDFTIATGEVTGKKIMITVADSATKAVEDAVFMIETYGHASAEYQPDLSLANQPANVTQWLGTAVSAPTVAGVPNVNAKTWNDLATVALPLTPTTAGRTLDVSATGESGLDFDNIKDATGAHTLTNIRVPNVTLADTVTTYTGNTPQTGDNYARIGAAGAGLTALASQTSVDDLPTNAELATALGTADDAVLTQVALVKAKTDNLPSDPADQSLVIAATDVIVAAIADKTGYRLSATGVNDILRTAMTEGYAADGATVTLEQGIYMMMSMLFDKSISGTTLTTKKLNGTTTAMTFTLDSGTAPTSQSRTT